MIAQAAIKSLMLSTLMLFAAVALAATYWAVAGRTGILLREDNPRLIEDIARIRRGGIYDRQEQLLVESVENSSGGMSRSYLRPSTYSLIGYYSLRYGSAGVEAAFNQILNGSQAAATLENYFLRELLNMPKEGADLRLTLLADVQDALTLAMQDQRGAGVVMDASSGAILAMASRPSYDPNTLDEDWESLVVDEGRPFFNRAVQGRYQPGTAMTILWLAQAIQSDYDLSRLFTEPAAPVQLEPGMRFKCLFQPASAEITLSEAFVVGCPAPFVKYQAGLARDSYAGIVERFALEEATTLAGFPVAGGGASAASGLDSVAESGAARSRDVLGQGDLTISPLQMTAIMSAIAADGAAPTATILSGIRQPGAEKWQEEGPGQSARLMMKPDTAAKLRALFQEAWHNLRGDSVPLGHEVGAKLAMSRSGEDSQLWLNGFALPEGRPAVAFVLVLENTDDIEALVTAGRYLAEAILSL